jgi:hypothetical protein
MARTLGLIVLIVVGFSYVACAGEVQVPLDSAGKVQTLSADLAWHMAMFMEYRDFQEARLYCADDSLFTLEVLHGTPPTLTRERRPLSRASVDSLRSAIGAKLLQVQPSLYIDQSGRTKLLVNSTVLGIFFYGPAVPYALQIDDGAAATGLYLLTAGGSFFIPWMATQQAPVTRASASLFTYGMTRGALFSYQLVSVFRGDEAEERGIVAFTIIGGTSAGIGGYSIGSAKAMTEGRAGMIGVGGDFGDALGMGFGALVDHSEQSEDEWRALAGWGLVGATGGIVLENSLARRHQYTIGDSYVIRGAGLLGIGVPLAFMGAGDVNDEDALLSVGILGGVAGLAAGHVLVRDQGYSVAAGQQAIVAELAGALAGLGIGTIYRGGRDDNGGLYIGGALGAIGGFTIAVYQHRRVASLFGERLNLAQLEPTILRDSERKAVLGLHVQILGR